MVGTTTDNRFGPTSFIVDPSAANGSYTTIQAAITAATSGTDIFIRPGTYTENITLKDGVNLTAFTRDTNIVTISGTITMNAAGTVNISGITVQTNAATAVSFSSANLQNLTFTNCNLTSTNADLVTVSNSNASSTLTFNNCTFTVAATYKCFVATMTGVVICINCNLGGASTTAWTSTAGNIVFRFCNISQVFSISTTATLQFYNCIIGTANLTFATLATGTSALFYNSRISTGSAIPFNITSTGTVTTQSCNISTSAATINTGTGTYSNGVNSYDSTVAVTSTSSKYTSSEISKVNVQTFTGNGTYTPTAGMKWCTVEVVGAGGGGAGAAAAGATTAANGGGGGGGGYARITLSAATIGTSQTVTIGTAGTAGSAGANGGGTGGTTTFGAAPLLQATGGSGGDGGGAASTSFRSGKDGGIGSLGDVNVSGGASVWAFGSGSATVAITAQGGNSIFGGGARAIATSGSQAGSAGRAYGGGGSGAATANSGAAAAGGAGAAGVCIVTEYI